MSPPPPSAAPAGAAEHASRALSSARILAMADALEERARAQSQPEIRTVLVATSRDFVFVRIAPRIVIGRSKDCGLVLDGPCVSRRHAELFVHRGELWIEDLGSTNGTTAAGERITRHALAPGEEVRLGGEPVRFWLR